MTRNSMEGIDPLEGVSPVGRAVGAVIDVTRYGVRDTLHVGSKLAGLVNEGTRGVLKATSKLLGG